MSTKLDARQTISRAALDQLASADAELDTILDSINSEFTAPLRIAASSPADLVINVGAISVQNTQTSRSRTIPPIANTLPVFAGGSITLPATSGGTVTVTPGTNNILTVSSGNYIKMGISIDAGGQLSVQFGIESATVDGATAPPPVGGTFSIGYVVIHNLAGTIQPISNSAIFQYMGGGGGGGAGIGEINVIESSSDSTNWDTSNATISTITSPTTANAPLYPVVDTSIQITSGTAGGYAHYRWTMPKSLRNRKLKVEWYQIAAALTLGDFKVEVWTNTQADYLGSYTELALSTDSSGTSAIPAADGKYATTFDGDDSEYYELRIVQTTASPKTIYLAGVIVGPGIQPQGAVVGEWQSYTPTWDAASGSPAIGNGTIVGWWRRVGREMEVKIHVETGTTTTYGTGQYLFYIPSGYTIDSSVLYSAARDYLGTARSRGTASNNEYHGNVIYYGHTDKVVVADDDTGAVNTWASNNPFTPTAARANQFWHLNFTVPIAEWAGSGTLNLAQNDAEYASNSNSSNTTDTTSFAYGPGGSPFPTTLSATGTAIIKRVKLQRPLLASGGVPHLEVSQDGISWRDAETWVPYLAVGSQVYGMRMVSGPDPSTEIDVNFGGDGAQGTAAWGGWGGAARWRIRVAQPGAAVGFSRATGTTLGLTTSYAPTRNSSVYTIPAAGNYTIQDGDGYDTICTTSGTSTVTLPNAASNPGRRITFKNTGSGTLAISGTIDGSTSNNTINAQYGHAVVFSNGSAWYWETPITETFTATAAKSGGYDGVEALNVADSDLGYSFTVDGVRVGKTITLAVICGWDSTVPGGVNGFDLVSIPLADLGLDSYSIEDIHGSGVTNVNGPIGTTPNTFRVVAAIFAKSSTNLSIGFVGDFASSTNRVLAGTITVWLL